MSCNCQNNCSCSSYGVELLKAQNGADAPAIIAVNVNPNNTLKFTFSDGSILNTQTPIQFNQNLTSYILTSLTNDPTNPADLVIPANTLTDDGDTLRIFSVQGLNITNGADDFNFITGGSTTTIIPNPGDINGLLASLTLEIEVIYNGVDTIKVYPKALITPYILSGLQLIQTESIYETRATGDVPFDGTIDNNINLGQTIAVGSILNLTVQVIKRG